MHKSPSLFSYTKQCLTNINRMAPKKPKKPAQPSVNLSPIKTDPQNNLLLEIYAKPGAKQTAITDVTDQGINVQINAPPVEGSANTALVKFMAAFLGVKSSSVSLERGHKSKNKVLKVEKVSREEVVKRINEELPEGANKLQEQ